MKKVLVLGGGISGLATAWHLHKAGIPFKLIEKQASFGGVIHSEVVDGTVIDFGPNSLRDKDGALRELAKDVGIGDDIVQISEAFKTRFIVRDRKLQALTPSPKTLLATNVVSGKGKLRALAEPFISKGTSKDESVGSFLERRVGKEIVDYLVDPVFSGIYAGDIYQMSKKEILPKLADNEQEFGSLLMGAFRSKKEQKSDIKPMVLTFKKGVQQLADAISEQIEDHILREEVTGITKTPDGFDVQTSKQVHTASHVISCLPAHSLASVIHGVDPDLNQTLQTIDYAPMLSTQVLFKQEGLKLPQSGFGFLIPRKENIRLLGAIWKSSIFPELSKEGHFHCTLMTGGAHDRDVLSDDIKKIEQEIIAEFLELLPGASKPVYVKSLLWEKAIPQFHVGYGAVRQELGRVEMENPGFYIGGNFRWGVSVPDCIKGGKALADQFKTSLK